MFFLKRVFIRSTQGPGVSEQERCNLLRVRGFTRQEIERLQECRRIYLEQSMSLASLTRRRLEFARWLVATGKLTEQVA